MREGAWIPSKMAAVVLSNYPNVSYIRSLIVAPSSNYILLPFSTVLDRVLLDVTLGLFLEPVIISETNPR